MSHPKIRPIDILSPPANQWLSELTRRKTDLPAGVRVVRFSEGDEDGLDKTEEGAGSSMSAA